MKIRDANITLRQLSEKKNNSRSEIENLETEVESKQDILKTLEKIEDYEQRKTELETTLSQTSEKVITQLKEFSKITLKKNKSNLMDTANDIIINIKNKIKGLHEDKGDLLKKQINAESDLKILQKHLDNLTSKREEFNKQVSELAVKNLGIEIADDDQIQTELNEDSINKKYEELLKKKCVFMSGIQGIERCFITISEFCKEHKSCFICETKLNKPKTALKTIKKNLSELLKEETSDHTQSSGEENESLDSKIESIGKIKYIINDLVREIDHEIEGVNLEMEELSQPITDIVINQKQVEIEKEEAKIDILSALKTDISKFNYYEQEIKRYGFNLTALNDKLKESKQEGYTQKQYKALTFKLSKQKKEQKKLEKEYELQRQERDEAQEQITNLQFEANNLRERRLKITQTNASLVESTKVMHSMEKDIATFKSEIINRESSFEEIKLEISQLKQQKNSTISDLRTTKDTIEKAWNFIEEPYIECGRQIKAIKNDKINNDEIDLVKIEIETIKKEQIKTGETITKLENLTEEIKKVINSITGGDRRSELLRKGESLHEQIKKLKDSLKKNCKHEDEIKEVRYRKKDLVEKLDGLKGIYNEKTGYNIRLHNDLKNKRMQLRHNKFKEITKSMSDLQIKTALAKMMSQEISE